MRVFLLHCMLFATLVVGSMYAVFLRADGTTDPYYLRFTTPRQASLVVGTSRAAQGVVPSVIDSLLAGTGAPPLYNFAFNMDLSPFGEPYHRAIAAKLEEHGRGGVFIVAVDPWALATDTLAERTLPRDVRRALGKVRSVSGHPNLDYLINAYEGRYIGLLTNDPRKARTRVADDGWLEVLLRFDSVQVARRTEQRLRTYRERHLPRFAPSPERWAWFERTVDLLRGHGRVVLVRLPVDPRMRALEDRLDPTVDARVEAMARARGSPYLTFPEGDGDFATIDGNHLRADAARRVSALIAERWLERYATR